ncbi:hypothetical protein FQR65_LT01178 [Abscondita terminalis]|nr:hypothetical protein FQR65_LT01178 [Abscondita terminalis]
MAPKKKRNPSGSKSNRKTRFAPREESISTLTHQQVFIEETFGDLNPEIDRISTSLVTEQKSIDCPENYEKENIDFDELISVSTIHVRGLKIEDELVKSNVQIHSKDSENEGEHNEITSKLSNLNVIEEPVENISDPIKMIIDESGSNVFGDTKQVIVEECVLEEMISVASEQEVESVVTNELEPVVDDAFTKDVDQVKDQDSGKSDKKAKTSKKSKSSKLPKLKVNKKKSVPSTKASKKETSSKVKPKKNSSKNFDNDNSDSSRRRSSRLKNISELKQSQTKLKSDKSSKNANDSDVSESSNYEPSDNDKALIELSMYLASSIYEGEQKPVKVKSRWRRSSELEFNEQKSEQDREAERISANNEEIKRRLKQFVHLKENQYLTGRVTCKEAKKMICDCVVTPEEIEKGELGCGEDCLNRLLLIECGPLCPVSDKCTNKRFQKSNFSPCEVFRTDKKGLGIRATANIPHGEFILEYVGEVIGPDEFDERATEYSKEKNPHYYFMSLRSDAVIDATQKGNISRFINHSCDPNAETQKWTVNGELRIGFFSKRTIIAGEEITFDYQFQRYGKEAQKCFCESSLCRGWLGEEPEEDEEEEEEEDAAVTEPAVSQVVEKVADIPDQQTTPEMQPPIPPTETVEDENLPPVLELAVQDSVKPNETPAEAPPLLEVKPPEIKKEKKKTVKRKVLKDMFEDVDVDEELEMLMATGLKNQAQTLKLSRLMVRAREISQRISLLRVLRRGEFPCRRLFLDYHGLRLIHGWMNEAQQLRATDEKQDTLRLGLLQTLVTLPIPNKTMLQDSKVLPTVELWSKKLVAVPPELDSESNSPKLETDSNTPPPSISKFETPFTIENEKEEEIKNDNFDSEHDKFEFSTSNDVFEIRKSVGMDIENIRSENLWREQENNGKLVQGIIDMFDEDMDISPVAFNDDESDVKSKIEEPKREARDYEFEIMALSKKLLEEWSVLKEVFRIPKKERVERMKEHEREADRGYNYRAGMEHHWDRRSSGSRYRSLQRSRSRRQLDDYYHSAHRINKHERRKLFAMKVEQEEVERRYKTRDIWRQPDLSSNSIGNENMFASPFDMSRNYQIVWNQQSGQWQTFPIVNPTRYNLGMNFSYPMTSSNVGNVNMGIPTISISSQSMPNSVTPQVQNITNMSLPPPNLVHLQQNMHRTSAMTNPVIGMQNSNQNSYTSVANIPIPTNIPPPSPITLSTNIPPPSPIHPTNIPPPNMQAHANIPLPNCPPPNINSHLSVSQPSFNTHQDKVQEVEDPSKVKFAGPIPPPAKLPPKWKCAKDKYGRPYYYHIKIRISQWEPPELPPPVDVEAEFSASESSSSSETSSLSSTSSSDDSEDDEVDDTKLLLGIRKKFQLFDSSHKSSPQIIESPEDYKEDSENVIADVKTISLDERLKDEFNLHKKESISHESSSRKKRLGLVTEVHIISVCINVNLLVFILRMLAVVATYRGR